MNQCIHIVTLHKSPNCGAFLQAWALGEILAPYCEGKVTYVDIGARSVARSLSIQLKRSARSRNLQRAVFELRKAYSYSRTQRLLSIDRQANSFRDCDVLVFGSDEIWNVNRAGWIAAYPKLWGEGIEGGRRIAYAPSSNGSVLDAFSGSDGFRESLLGFTALSARDAWTASEVSRVTGRDVSVVCDPTLLLGVEEYRAIQKAQKLKVPYLLVYSYGDKITKDEINDVRAVANRLNLRLVSADFWLPWCDECVPCGPLGFLSLLDGAKAVVTDTFHGTVFSTIYHKRFASFARLNDKVRDFLDRAGLASRDASNGDLAEILGCDVDWTETEERISEFRSSSEMFLKDALSS